MFLFGGLNSDAPYKGGLTIKVFRKQMSISKSFLEHFKVNQYLHLCITIQFENIALCDQW